MPMMTNPVNRLLTKIGRGARTIARPAPVKSSPIPSGRNGMTCPSSGGFGGAAG
jgi:hypothetical protein